MSERRSFRDQLINASNSSSSKNTHKNDIESPDYDPMDDILSIFHSPNSLGDLDEMLSYINIYKLQIEDEINSKKNSYNKFVIENSNSDNNLTSIEDLLTNLIDDFNDTKNNAETTGSTINEMTANIKSLDNSKKNLTLSMTILKRLQMLITAYDNLNNAINDSSNPVKKYHEIKQMLSVVMELMQHFQTYKSIDEINTLNKKIGSTKNKIIDEIFSDFEKEIQGELRNPELVEGCNLLDMLGKAYHDKLANWYITTLLKEITTIFKTTEEAGSLDNLKRRFIFFQRLLSNFEATHSSAFPTSWRMSLELAKRFCDLTKKDLKEVTAKESRLNGSKVDVNLLLNSLSETLEFEVFLNQKFKYHDIEDDEVHSFDRTISDVFEPYLNIWMQHQGTVINEKFIDFMNPTNMLKKSGIDQPSSSSIPANESKNDLLNVLESAADLFRLYRQMLSQLSKLSQGEPLIKLAEVFSKYLLKYQQKILEPILPDNKKLSSSTQDDQIEGVGLILLVLNTADYCSVTIGQLEDKLISLIQPQDIARRVDFEEAKDAYLNMINNCINLLFFKIEHDLQLAWREMSNNNWKTVKEISGESRYLSTVKTVLTEDCELVFPKFNRVLYIRNFLDKLIELVLNELTISILKLKPITEHMAEQFLLDLQTLKIFFLELPNKAPEGGSKISTSSIFIKSTTTKINKIDSILKILMVQTSPTDQFINSYFTIIRDSNFSNFIKVLKLKGLLNNESTYEKEKFRYLDHFKSQLRAYEELNEDPLDESNDFLHNLRTENLPALTSSLALSMLSSSTHQSATTNSNKLSQGLGVAGSEVGTSITNFFNNSNPNFKIDKQSLMNTRDQFEKNIAKTFNINNDNRININENIKNFGKLFKKN